MGALRSQRIPAFTLTITLAFASLTAACGGGDDSSVPDTSTNGALPTTTLELLTPKPIDVADSASNTEDTVEPAPTETTMPTTVGDTTATKPAPDPAPTETTTSVGEPETIAGPSTTTAPATTTTGASTTGEEPTTTTAAPARPTTTGTPSISDEPTTTTAAPTTTTTKTLSRQEIVEAAAANISLLKPNSDRRLIEVLNVADGSITSLAEAVDGDRPVLVWFWAPH